MHKVDHFFTTGRRAVRAATGKTRISILVDEAVLARFRAQSQKTGRGVQALIDEALKAYVERPEPPVTQEAVPKAVREEPAARKAPAAARAIKPRPRRAASAPPAAATPARKTRKKSHT